MGLTRTLLAAAAVALAVPAGAGAQTAGQAWPVRPIHVIVGAGPGGGTDIVTRIIAPPLIQVCHAS